MKFVVTPSEMKEYDNNAINNIGIPSLVLMERAALRMQEEILKRLGRIHTALIVSGVGNNGADGLVLARLLAEDGCAVTVCMIGSLEKATVECKTQKEILTHYPVKVLTDEEARTALKHYAEAKAGFQLVVDALFGVGLNRELSEYYTTVVDYMNEIPAYKVATDIPSGICGRSGQVLGKAFCADLTVSFAFVKRGMLLYPGSDYVGQLEVVDIGISKNCFQGGEPQIFIYDENPVELLPVRNSSGNKGTFGKVLIIAGFEQMAGAAVLCAKAALRMGAGMVKVICPEHNRSILQTAVPEVLYGTADTLQESLDWADVAAIGPGLGKTREAFRILQFILENAGIPLILDADALNIISEEIELEKALKSYHSEKIMTPHMGEWSRLEKRSISRLKEDVFDSARQSAKEYGAIMVCKDARTLVADTNGKVCVNVTGNNGMATAGSGDVLTGMIAGLFAQCRDTFRSASVGVYLHGLSGDAARDIYTEYGVTAGRMVEKIFEM